LHASSSSMMPSSLPRIPLSGTSSHSCKAWATVNPETLVVGTGCCLKSLSLPYTTVPRHSSMRAWATGVNGTVERSALRDDMIQVVK
jgi:hypothetical protein